MPNDTMHTLSGAAGCDQIEEALNQYVDGELASARQSALFQHLATCDECRKTLEAVLAFRRMSRLEKIAVPPAVDATLMERLAQHKKRNALVDRRVDRNPLWETRRPISIGVAVVACVAVFLAGIFISSDGEGSAKDAVPESVIEGFQEVVNFDKPEAQTSEAIYVFYPGITIEAQREAETETAANH